MKVYFDTGDAHLGSYVLLGLRLLLEVTVAVAILFMQLPQLLSFTVGYRVSRGVKYPTVKLCDQGDCL